jgi:hypothetical protein
MRTTAQATQSPSDTAMRDVRPATVFGLRWLSAVLRRLTGRRAQNSVVDLDAYQLRDIGVEDGRVSHHGLSDRAARQDAVLRQAHQQALYLAIGMRGR